MDKITKQLIHDVEKDIEVFQRPSADDSIKLLNIVKGLDQFENHIKEEYAEEALEYLWNNIEDFGKKAKYADGEKGWLYNCVNLAVATNAINIMRGKAVRDKEENERKT